MSLIVRLFRSLGLFLLAAVFLAQSRPAAPDRLGVTPTTRPVQPSPDIESPALYDILRQIKNLQTPAESQGLPYNRAALLSKPQAFLGYLIAAPARYIETKPVSLADPGNDHPPFAWSTLATDPNRTPIQVLSLGPRPQFPRLANVRCVGYFYKVRRDRAAVPDRNGSLPEVEIPVLVGWVLPGGIASTTPSFSPAQVWQIFGLAVAAAMVLFFVMFIFVRRRVDWRTRLAHRRGSVQRPEQTDKS